MSVYKSEYSNRGSIWNPPADYFTYPQHFSDPECYPPKPHCFKCPYYPYPPRKPCPPRMPHFPQPYCYPIPYPYPVPYPDKPKHCPDPYPKKHRDKFRAFGYFASVTTGGAFAGGVIPLTFADPLNRNIRLIAPANTQVEIQIPGVYRIVYSVTTTSASSGVFLQLLRNGQVVSASPIPIQEGVNQNEIFLFLNRGDTLSLNLTGAVTLANGKNASILLQLISRN
nr:MAG: hypothetical protein DIU81_03295 [[Clostridium] cellulosi]